ncbi:MAG: sensor histidine kinase [Myxococcales bacterium]|nr:MAG: sensor histidine kinase [Myxococcales bacterium]
MSLTTRIIVINGLCFAIGTMILALAPVTVSQQPLVSELIVLSLGLTVIILANSVLVRRSMRDVDDVIERAANAQRERDLAALAAQEAERARIAQELHDGVGQSLTAVLLEAGALAQHEPRFEGVREGTRASLDEIRRVARSLRPHVLEDLGLHSALRALATDLFDKVDTHVERAISPGVPELDEPTELVVFRVAQEALTNVARHAHARNVTLRLGQVGDHVELMVIDDGIGVGGRTTDGGTGVRGMQERAALVGGEVTVERRDGGGTIVRLKVPVS